MAKVTVERRTVQRQIPFPEAKSPDEQAACFPHLWTYRRGASVCASCGLTEGSKRGLPHDCFSILGEAVLRSTAVSDYTCGECGAGLRVCTQPGKPGPQLVCWNEHNVGELGNARPRKRSR